MEKDNNSIGTYQKQTILINMIVYKNISIGDTFYFEGNHYMKTPSCHVGKFRHSMDYIICNCVNLNTGQFGFVGNSLEITMKGAPESREAPDASPNNDWNRVRRARYLE